MRQEFYDVYRELNEIYKLSQYDREYYQLSRPWHYIARPGFDLLTFRKIEDAITQAAGELQLVRRLRPDAVHFLLVNLHQMVALPLAAEPRTSETAIPLDSLMRADTITILEAARDEAGDGEITGHNIIDALSKSWEKLKISTFEVWG